MPAKEVSSKLSTQESQLSPAQIDAAESETAGNAAGSVTQSLKSH
jgi:hypothetical protein